MLGASDQAVSLNVVGLADPIHIYQAIAIRNRYFAPSSVSLPALPLTIGRKSGLINWRSFYQYTGCQLQTSHFVGGAFQRRPAACDISVYQVTTVLDCNRS